MRYLIVLSILFMSACVSKPPQVGEIYSPQTHPELYPTANTALAGPIDVPPPADPTAQERIRKNQQAAAICQYKGKAITASRPYQGLLNLDAEYAGRQIAEACWNTYQQTGIVPTP